MKVYTSNIFVIIITITTATREPIEWTTIGGTAGKTSDINTRTIATFTDRISTSDIITTIDITSSTTITIDKINVETGTTSVININSSDTRADVSELAEFDLLLLTGVIIEIEIITIIQIIITNNTPLDGSELAE